MSSFRKYLFSNNTKTTNQINLFVKFATCCYASNRVSRKQSQTNDKIERRISKTRWQIIIVKKRRAPANTVTWFVKVATDRSLRAYKAGAWPSYVQGRFYLYRKRVEGLIELSNRNLSYIFIDNIGAPQRCYRSYYFLNRVEKIHLEIVR